MLHYFFTMDHLFNNAHPFQKIGYRLRSYVRVGTHAMRHGVSPLDIVRSRFPFSFQDPARPASLSIELTDACDLKCPYCTNPGFPLPRAFMAPAVVEAITHGLRTFPVSRVRVSGGEPTLHPKFDALSAALALRTRFLSLITNAQWRKPGIAEAVVQHYRLVEISIDAGGAEQYERSRPNGSFERLVTNLSRLNTLRAAAKVPLHINVRLMLRPSTRHLAAEEQRRWSRYADSVMPQYVLKDPENPYADDVFLPEQAVAGSFPKCTLPFKDLQVRVNGDVPLCQITGSTTDAARKRIIGNVLHTSLEALWTGEALRTVRQAHRYRVEADMAVCRGCRGC